MLLHKSKSSIYQIAGAIFALAASFLFATNANATNIESGNEIELNSDLSYYVTVNYDGVDVFGVESNDRQMANITSGRIKVVDELPKGLEFKSFVTTPDGTIGAISRTDGVTRCGGKVYDDTPNNPLDTGVWNAANTEYTYHGLHYDKASHTVSFYAENLRAGCKLTVGIITQAPAAVDDPDTEPIEIRRDFYNIAQAFEGNLAPKSNVVHGYIGRDITTLYKVKYEYTGDVPANAPTPPEETEHAIDDLVGVASNPTMEGYTFSGWTTTDATVENGAFTMPATEVTFTGSFTAVPAPAKYNVQYVIDGDTPDGYVAPKTKSYTAATEVPLDETATNAIKGYTFSGWTSEDATLSDTGFTMPEQDVTIHGSFTQNKYTVSYAFEGQIIPPNADTLLPETKTYAEGEQVTLATDPAANGYRFAGWYSEQSFTMPDHNITITGEWKREEGVFAPEISIRIINNKDKFDNGETVQFETTITNAGEFDIADVYVQELLEGATFSQSAPLAIGDARVLIANTGTGTGGGSSDYDLETDTLAHIANIPKGGSVKLYSSYTPNVQTDTSFTNTVRLLGADPADNNYAYYNFDTSAEHTASVGFVVAIRIPINPQTIDTIGKTILVITVCCSILIAAIRLGRGKKTIAATIQTSAKKSLPIMLISSGIILAGALLANVSANDAVPSIEIGSERASFNNGDAGAWKITKSAKWTSKTTAEITLAVDSKPKFSTSDKDIIIVLDNSTSMEGDRLTSLKNETKELIQDTLVNQNNQIALITFASDANIVVPFTNNTNELKDGIDSMVAYGSTNYFKALSKVEELLESYQPETEREIVVLFLTDGAPVQQTPQETAKYIALKANYENLTINSVQFEMGSTIMPQLESISDNYFIVESKDDLDKDLFQAASVPYYYTSFNVADYIDTDYWELVSASTNSGTTSINSEEARVDWNAGRHFRPGQSNRPTLSINIKLKDEYHEADSSWPTNTRTEITSSILDGEDENVTSTNTPVLQHKYNVHYEANLPSGCTSDISLPETKRYFVFDAVEIQEIDASCEGYNFGGWQIATPGVSLINSDYVRMPSADLAIRATWTKLRVEKAMDGTLHEKANATFNIGTEVNIRMKTLSGERRHNYNDDNNSIVAIKRAARLSTDVDLTNRTHILSANNSETPIYAWYDNGTIYYYTDADNIYLNANSKGMFQQMRTLSDISALTEWNSSNVTTTSEMFFKDSALENIDAMANWDMTSLTNAGLMFRESGIQNVNGAANWNMSSVTNLVGTFEWANSLSDISGLADWDVSHVTSLNDTFAHTISLTNLDALAGWDVSNVKNMRYAFSKDTALTDISGISGWTTTSLENLGYAFSESGITNTDALSGWNTDNLTKLDSTFYGSKITNVDGLAEWNVSNVTTMNQTFAATPITNVNGLEEWTTSSVTDMGGIFLATGKLTDASGVAGWNTSNVTNMASAFSSTGLADIDDLSEWNTSSVTNMTSMFSGSASLENIDGAAKWNVEKVEKMDSMFASNRKLTNIDGAAEWKTLSLKSMSYMFSYDSALTQVNGAKKWNTSQVTDMSGVFNSCSNLSNIDGIADWDTSNVTSMYIMFQSPLKLTNLDALAKWNVEKVQNTGSMFNNGIRLTNIDGLAKWKTNSLKSMDGMFSSCAFRSTAALKDWNTANVASLNSVFYRASVSDLSGIANWDLTNVKSMSSLFGGANNIGANLSQISGWDVSGVTNMSYMFSQNHGITSLDALSGWDTKNVTYMNGMFSEADALVNVNGLSGWDTSKVTSMEGMFRRSRRLEDISGLSSWDVTKVTNMIEMFYDDTQITSLEPLNDWTPTNLEKRTNMFYGIPSEVERPDW